MDSTNLCSISTGGGSPRVKRPENKVVQSLHVVSNLRMCGALIPSTIHHGVLLKHRFNFNFYRESQGGVFKLTVMEAHWRRNIADSCSRLSHSDFECYDPLREIFLQT